MICSICGEKKILLFFSYACGCNEPKVQTSTESQHYTGYFVKRVAVELPTEEYVWASKNDAEKWKDLNGLSNAHVLEVHSRWPFKWQPTKGTVRNLTIADKLYIIHSCKMDAIQAGYPADTTKQAWVDDGN